MQLATVMQAITTLMDQSTLNAVPEIGLMRIYDQPLIGVAGAHDELFGLLAQEHVVGSQHLRPQDWLPDAQSVVSYFLPFSEQVRQANRAGALPAVEWLYARIEGEVFNNAVRRCLVDVFSRHGHSVIAPALDERFAVVQRRSNWSERHVGFVAGLGTFSLSRSFITKAGAAGRLGSVITTAAMKITPREYHHHEAYCSKCGICIRRCPPQAIDKHGKDNSICSAYVDTMRERFQPRYGCGKCQTGVPCEAAAPGLSS